MEPRFKRGFSLNEALDMIYNDDIEGDIYIEPPEPNVDTDEDSGKEDDGGKMGTNTPTFKLRSGYDMPLIGLGTYLVTGKDQIKDVLDKALAAGYRAIDTAAVYRNEQDIGSALKELLPKYNLKREDIFITSKLSPDNLGSHVKESLQKSLADLQITYLDLYLIHWPGSNGLAPDSSENPRLRSATWLTLVKAKEEGLVRDIGVSNYTVRHLNELLENDHGLKPSLNQVEWHPGCYQNNLKDLCEREGILLQAYMSLGGTGNKSLLSNEVVARVAQKLGKSPAQVLLRWSLQQNIAVIPKARSKQHLEDNLDLNFVIPDEDMSALNGIEAGRIGWDPNSVK